MNHTTTPAHHLNTVIRHWDDLRDMLDTPPIATWPPSGLAAYLAALDDQAREQLLAEAAAERNERNSDALGERPVPIRLAVLDTIRSVEAALIALADVIASTVQRPPMSPAPADWPQADRQRRDRLADADRADPRRWPYTGPRTAPQAAAWLRARTLGQPGPHQPLTPDQHRHIAAVAAEAARRVTAALGMARTSRPIDRPCPRDGGPLTMHSGGTEQPQVTCSECGSDWTGHELYELLRALDPAA